MSDEEGGNVPPSFRRSVLAVLTLPVFNTVLYKVIRSYFLNKRYVNLAS